MRPQASRNVIGRMVLALILVVAVLSAGTAWAQSAPPSLKTVPVPLPGDLSTYIKNTQAAMRLGKALFWDTQVGGDGQVACATCHYSAGVDTRSTHTVKKPVVQPDGTTTVVITDAVATDFPMQHGEIAGSQGVAQQSFQDIHAGFAADICTGASNGERQVTGRNAPNMIMAIFNRVNFWDGRAMREFNGVNIAGTGDRNARIWVANGTGPLKQQQIVIKPASQASQEVGPPNSKVEMSCDGRTFPKLGRKMLSLTPLGQQTVDPTDSLLGGPQTPAYGLNTTYTQMIKDAFQDKFWNSTSMTPDGFKLMEANFSLFWGLSIMMYGRTLIPDDTPYDRFAEGNTSALTAQQQAGLQVFLTQGQCSACHGGAEFTNASIQNGGNGASFTNTGVTPTAADPGQQPDAEGKFKVPTLRNVDLTGPYFHNGGYLTLRQVVEFYNGGGDVANLELDSHIRPLGLSEAQKVALVDFLTTLTDDRVRYEKAPFDRPSITVVGGGPVLQAVGSAGHPGQPVLPFLNANPFDCGSRCQ